MPNLIKTSQELIFTISIKEADLNSILSIMSNFLLHNLSDMEPKQAKYVNTLYAELVQIMESSEDA